MNSSPVTIWKSSGRIGRIMIWTAFAISVLALSYIGYVLRAFYLGTAETGTRHCHSPHGRNFPPHGDRNCWPLSRRCLRSCWRLLGSPPASLETSLLRRPRRLFQFNSPFRRHQGIRSHCHPQTINLKGLMLVLPDLTGGALSEDYSQRPTRAENQWIIWQTFTITANPNGPLIRR